MAQHKWHKEIKAWADGVEIECKFLDELWDLVGHFPPFDDDDYLFRIKPQPKEPQYLYVYMNDKCEYFVHEASMADIDSNGALDYIGKIKLEDE